MAGIEWRERDAVAADVPVLAELERALFGRDAWSEALLADELARMPESRQVLVVVADDDPVGYAILRVTGELGEVQRLGVVPGWRRRGIARTLVERLIEEARRRGCREVLLEVATSNAGAIALYEGVGFVSIGRRPGYYAGGTEDAVVMRLDLTGRRPPGAVDRS